MESTGRNVSRDDEEFPEDTDKVLNAVTKTSYPTENQLEKETGLSVGRIRRALRHLENSNLIREQVGSIHGTMYKLVPLGPKVPIDKRKTRGDSPKTLELMTKVKELYKADKRYAEISRQLKIPQHKVSYLCGKLIKAGEIKRRYLAPHAPVSEPKSTEVEIPIIVTNDGEEDHEDDEPKVLEQAAPDVAEILKAFQKGTVDLQRLGLHVELILKLTFPDREVAVHLGAS